MTAAATFPRPNSPRLRLRVRGAVQGVGFRPFAYGLAQELALSGFVLNDAEGVLIEIEGAGAKTFVETLRNAPPPLARIDAIEIAECAPRGDEGFSIDTTRAGRALTRIGADAAVCEDCLEELFDPASRFYHYPLVNCTHCGPRYTLTRSLPYDRAQTSMAPFAMCDCCARDYRGPANRRFHAEPIACPRCGPNIDVSVETIAQTITAGGIVAVKGVGGYHLICDALNEATVARLRVNKARESKPFAVMVLNVASAERLAHMNEAERALLTSRAAPIVLMKANGRLAPSVAPRLSEIGVMLPYTPLHWLIFYELQRRHCEEQGHGPAPAPSWPGSSRPSTSHSLDEAQGVRTHSSGVAEPTNSGREQRNDVDGRDEPGHDEPMFRVAGSSFPAAWRASPCDFALVATSANLGASR